MPKSIEKCEEMKQKMKQKILDASVLYFAKNGLAGTKISELAKYIGIGQGTLYQYFASKEELFLEIYKIAEEADEIKQMKTLVMLPISAKQKMMELSKYILHRIQTEQNYAGMIALNTKMYLEGDIGISKNKLTYQAQLYEYTEKIIQQGQKQGTFVEGNPMKLADYYWSVVYLYAIKQLFTSNYEMIDEEDLNRTVLKS